MRACPFPKKRDLAMLRPLFLKAGGHSIALDRRTMRWLSKVAKRKPVGGRRCHLRTCRLEISSDDVRETSFRRFRKKRARPVLLRDGRQLFSHDM